MAFIEWTAEYGVGVRQFDVTIKSLIAIANDLHDHIRAPKTDQVFSDILARLDVLNATEVPKCDALLEQYGYPKAQEHLAQHAVARAGLAHFRSDLSRSDTRLLAMEMTKLIKGWLLLHVASEDKQAGIFLNSKGVY